ncbi:MAG: LemA family protein [Candidatus Kerfeldbacteria bacterium]|nr:LemA family protein [Candidatus Kerfeldbacteria bacterium]
MWIALGIILVIILILVVMYNGLVAMRNRVDEAWSDIDVQLKRRHDLIPNLVETVKGYATHEQETFTKVIEARNMAMQAQSGGAPEAVAQAENMLSGTLKSLFALSENYPQLRANENFMRLQDELSDTENKIQASRRFYNGMVRDYNTKTQTVPTNVMAKMFGFTDRTFFELDSEEERKNVSVQF